MTFLGLRSLKLVQRSFGLSPFVRAMADPEERWAGLGGSDAYEDGAAGDGLLGGGDLPLDGGAGRGEAASMDDVANAPWWWDRYQEWKRQGWNDREIFEYLGQWDDSHSGSEWQDSHSHSSILNRWNDGSEQLTHWNDGSSDLNRWNEHGSSKDQHFAGWPHRGLSSRGEGWNDPWAEAAASLRQRRGSGQQSEGTVSDRPTEKIPVPSFNGASGEEGEVGSSARSYLRKVEAWERVTRLPPHQRGVALYTALRDRAWVDSEALDLENLGGAFGVKYFKAWIKERYMDVEVTQVGRIMSQFFRGSSDQSVRSFSGEFDRLVARLAEVQVVLPETVLAWMYVDKLRLDESGEIALLASVQNQYRLKLLQEAALVHDRSLRKPWEESRATRRDTRGRDQARSYKTVNVAELDEDREDTDASDFDGGENEEGEACIVSEEVASSLHEAYVLHQNAKSRYREALQRRGYDDAEQRKQAEQRLQRAKERSFCSACKKKGHWHRDPQCPLNQSKGVHFSVATTHQVNVCSIFEAKMDPSYRGPLLAVTDTACASTVVGHPWLGRYMEQADKGGLSYRFGDDYESYRFGASRVFKAEFAAWLPMRVMGKWVVLKASVVACDVPFLMGKPTLKELGMKMDMTKSTVEFGSLGTPPEPWVDAPGGHPAVLVFSQGGPLVQEFPWDEILRATAKPGGVWYPSSAQESYMAESRSGEGNGATIRPGKSSTTGLFYAKKLSPEVESMLVADELQVDTFLGWWKQTNCSRDFWIETREAFYRIHITPRKYNFSPVSWNTVREDLKERLIGQLGTMRTMTRIPCHGVPVAVSESGCWKSESSKQDNTLWIGRSRFEKTATSNSRATPSPGSVFHGQFAGPMEPQQEGARRGAGALRGRDSPEVDGVRDPQHGSRTARGPARGGEGTGGIVEDDVGPTSGRSQTGRGYDPEEAHERSHDEDREGSSGRPRGDDLPVWPLPGVGVQPDPDGVPRLGSARGGSQREPERRPSSPGQLAQRFQEQSSGDCARRVACRRPRGDCEEDTAEPIFSIQHKLDQGDSEGFTLEGGRPRVDVRQSDERGDPARDTGPAGPNGGFAGGSRQLGGVGSPEAEGEEACIGHGGIEGCLSPLSIGGKCRNAIFKQAKQLKCAMDKCVNVYKVALNEDLEDTNMEPEDGVSEYACLEVNNGTDMVWKAFQEEGWGIMGPCDLRQEACPEYRAEFMEGVVEDVTAMAPEIAWLCPPTEPWMAAPGEHLRDLRRARKAERGNVKVTLDLFDIQVGAGRQAVLAHPIQSELWEVPSVKRLAERWDTYVTHFDMEAYGSYAGEEMRTMRAVCTHEVLGRALSLRQEGERAVLPGDATSEVPRHLGQVVYEAARRVKQDSGASASGFEVLVTQNVANEGDAAADPMKEIRDPGAAGITFDEKTPRALQSALRRMHQNLGHIGNDELARHLRLSGAPKDVIKAVKGLRCQTCRACQRPASARPAKPVPVLDFNDVLGIDVIHVDDALKKKHRLLSMVDYGSTYHVVKAIIDSKASTITECVREAWISWAGPPRAFALDLDSGFKEVFVELCSQCNAHMSHSAGQAH